MFAVGKGGLAQYLGWSVNRFAAFFKYVEITIASIVALELGRSRPVLSLTGWNPLIERPR